MTEYLSNAQLRASGTAGEFCTAEKQAYMDTMKAHFPHQYDNLVKVDASTYWVSSVQHRQNTRAKI